LDANHCPGAVQFLFRIPRSSSSITGDDSSNNKTRPLRPWEAPTSSSSSSSSNDSLRHQYHYQRPPPPPPPPAPAAASSAFRGTTVVLHTGDCRASPEMVAGAVAWLRGLGQGGQGGGGEGGGKGGGTGGALVDVVYLDTTYCDPRVRFWCWCWCWLVCFLEKGGGDWVGLFVGVDGGCLRFVRR
jgi:hypothetical protein